MADTEFTELLAERLVLRRFRAGDAAAFATYRSDPAVARYQSWEAPFPVERALRGSDELIGDCDELYAVLRREWPAPP